MGVFLQNALFPGCDEEDHFSSFPDYFDHIDQEVKRHFMGSPEEEKEARRLQLILEKRRKKKRTAIPKPQKGE